MPRRAKRITKLCIAWYPRWEKQRDTFKQIVEEGAECFREELAEIYGNHEYEEETEDPIEQDELMESFIDSEREAVTKNTLKKTAANSDLIFMQNHLAYVDDTEQFLEELGSLVEKLRAGAFMVCIDRPCRQTAAVFNALVNNNFII